MLDHAVKLNILGFNLGLSVHTIYMIGISIALLILLPWVAGRRSGRIKVAAEGFVCFVRDEIVLPSMGEDGRKLVPFFCSMLIFLLLANYIGLMPMGVCITANISVTLGMAAVSGLVIIGLSIRQNGFGGFLKTFIPAGVPWFLAPFIFVLEVISLFIRIIVLAIRLFANMAAGHMVLLGLFGVIFLMGLKGMAMGYASAGPIIMMTLFVTLLEFLVAAIQAYVFTLLTAIFAGLQLHTH